MSGIDTHHAMPCPTGIGRAVGPWSGLLPVSQGVALGWYGDGPLALKIQTTSGPPEADLFFRVNVEPPFFRANGASPYQPGAMPQESRQQIHRGPKARPISPRSISRQRASSWWKLKRRSPGQRRRIMRFSRNSACQRFRSEAPQIRRLIQAVRRRGFQIRFIAIQCRIKKAAGGCLRPGEGC